jgi:hypothetical protein
MTGQINGTDTLQKVVIFGDIEQGKNYDQKKS